MKESNFCNDAGQNPVTLLRITLEEYIALIFLNTFETSGISCV